MTLVLHVVGSGLLAVRGRFVGVRRQAPAVGVVRRPVREPSQQWGRSGQPDRAARWAWVVRVACVLGSLGLVLLVSAPVWAAQHVAAGSAERTKDRAAQPAPTAQAPPVANSLTALVPDDVGLVVHVRDLRGQLRLLERSPLYRRLQSLEAFRAWTGSKGFRQLKAAAAYVETLADRPFRQLVEDLFGQSVVLGVWPRQGAEPNVVLLTRAASERRLKELLQVWQDVDERQATSVKYQGQTYFRWQKRSQAGKPARPFFYWLLGPVLVLSNDEPTLRRTIDLANGRGREDGERPLSRSDWFSDVRNVPASAAVVVGLNPRAWDRDVAAEGNRAFTRLWQQCRSLTGWLDFVGGRGVRLQVAARWQAVTPATSGPAGSDLEGVGGLPTNCPTGVFLAAYGRLAVRPGSVKAFEELLSPRERRDWQSGRRVLTGLLLGLDPFDQLLPACRGRWEALVLSAASRPEPTLPFDVVVRLPVDPERTVDAAGRQLTLRQAVDNALLTAGNLLATLQNARSDKAVAYLRSERFGPTQLHWLENFAYGQPAYAWHSSSLLLATSRAALRRVLEAGSSPAGGRAATEQKQSALPAAARRVPAGADQVVLADLRQLRQWLAERESALVELLGGRSASRRRSVQQRLRRLQDLCQAADFAYLAVDLSERATAVTVGVELLPTD